MSFRGRGRGRGTFARGPAAQQRPKSAFDEMLSQKYTPSLDFKVGVTMKQNNSPQPSKLTIEATDTASKTTFTGQVYSTESILKIQSELGNKDKTTLYLVKSGDDDSHAHLINKTGLISRLRLVNTKDHEYRALYALFDVRLKTQSRHRYHVGQNSIPEQTEASSDGETNGPETVVSARYQSGLTVPIGARHQYESYLQHRAAITQSATINPNKPLTDENENSFCALHNGHIRFKLVNKAKRRFYATLLSGRPGSVRFFVVPNQPSFEEPAPIEPTYEPTEFEMAPYDSLYFEHSGEGPFTTVLVSGKH